MGRVDFSGSTVKKTTKKSGLREDADWQSNDLVASKMTINSMAMPMRTLWYVLANCQQLMISSHINDIFLQFNDGTSVRLRYDPLSSELIEGKMVLKILKPPRHKDSLGSLTGQRLSRIFNVATITQCKLLLITTTLKFESSLFFSPSQLAKFPNISVCQSMKLPGHISLPILELQLITKPMDWHFVCQEFHRLTICTEKVQQKR
jgi:hypothetical protein